MASLKVKQEKLAADGEELEGKTALFSAKAKEAEQALADVKKEEADVAKRDGKAFPPFLLWMKISAIGPLWGYTYPCLPNSRILIFPLLGSIQ